MVDDKSEGILGDKNNTRYKIIVSILFGLLGFVVNFYSIDFPFPPYTATVLIGLLFPMLITLTWGWRYGLLSALAGGCQSIWWIWGPSNGYAILTLVPPFTLWILWHGYFADMRRKSDDRKWWQNMYVVEIPFRILTTINLLTLVRWAVSLNPPPWGWASEAPNVVPMEFSIFVVIKQFVVGYVILLLADVLLNIEFTRRFFGLEKRPGHTETGYIISLSLLLGAIFWIIGSVVFSLIFYPGSSFLDMLALNIPPVVLFMRTFFILACLAGGLLFSKLLQKHFETELKYKNLYSMVRLMCDNLPDLIWTKDLKSRFIFVNKSCCEVLLNAKDTDEPIGKDDIYFAEREKASHPGNPDYHTFGETCTDSDLTVMETKKPIWGDESGNLKGENITLDVYKAPFLDENNNMLGTVGCARDITKEKELEEARIKAGAALQETSDYLNKLIDYTNAPFVVWNPEFRIERVNHAFERLTDYTADELVGTELKLYFPEESLQQSMENVERTLSDEYWESIELPIQTKDGNIRHMVWNSANLYDKDGETVTVTIAQGIDITEQKHLMDEIKQMNIDLEQKVEKRTSELTAVNKELEAFSYSVSHDLRAPLRSVDGFSQALLEDYGDKFDETGTDYLNRVRNATLNMGHLIDDLLNLSRITRGELDSKEVDLSEMVSDIVERYKTEEPDRHVDFIIDQGVKANGDERLLRAMIENLISNAYKFSSHELITKIEFGTTNINNEITYFIRDNGVGFDMKYSDKLFGAFQRLHSKSEFPGTGIGLATVQRVIHKHGGNVWAESELGKGATFYFTL